MNELQNEKKEIRKLVARRFREQKELCAAINERFADADACGEFLREITGGVAYKSAFGYAEIANEIPCLNLLKRFAANTGNVTALPVVTGDELVFRQADFSREGASLVTGESFGILEPDERCRVLLSCLPQTEAEQHREIELLVKISPILVLTPGRAFTEEGGRLGRGGGFYDKFFEKLSALQAKNCGVSFTAVGLAYRFQMFDSLPCEATDFKLQKVVAF